jgi:ribosome-binding protein aMBF1 (putative translation factor)
MRSKRWRFYETASGAKPVQAFLDNLTAAEAAEVVAAMKEVTREGQRSADSACNITKGILNMISSMPRRTKPSDDLERYIAERDARDRGFAALVADADARLAFGRQMAERRRAKGKTQTQIAALMQTSPAIVSRLESGHDVRVSTLEKYVAALGFQLELKAVSPRKPTTKTSRTRRTKK